MTITRTGQKPTTAVKVLAELRGGLTVALSPKPEILPWGDGSDAQTAAVMA